MEMRQPTGQETREQLRAAILAHDGWKPHAKTHGLNLGSLTMPAARETYRALYGRDFIPAMVESDGYDHTRSDSDTADLLLGMDESEPAPVNEADSTDAASRLANSIRDLLSSGRAAPLDEAKVIDLIQRNTLDYSDIIDLVRENSAQPATVNLNITGAYAFTAPDMVMHHAFPALLAALAAGVNVMLVGPAGSGKTTAAEQAAKVLGRQFGFTGAIASEYKLTGFIDAQGRVVETEFLRRYRDGGLFLFDEMDGSAAGALLAFNAALANGHGDFPAGIIPRHKDFLAVGACNTYGRAQDRMYVGRSQQDGASLDRWAILDWNYDTGLEHAMVGLPRPSDAPAPVKITPIEDEKARLATVARWTAKVGQYRAKLGKTQVKHIISPRATIFGAKLLIAGWPESLVMEGVIWKGLNKDDRTKIENA